jgi:hypothetical protein
MTFVFGVILSCLFVCLFVRADLKVLLVAVTSLVALWLKLLWIFTNHSLQDQQHIGMYSLTEAASLAMD